ncbi:MAG: XdhC family protein [Synechococcales cyanobacterium K44_A2020_017]|nr:XdhC family protein [Synechococcales cyanobacterium K32_A2020_035]MBF2096032.1 XdhC family protein [Synechococcales cyanobacterium K44_A2020_017]
MTLEFYRQVLDVLPQEPVAIATVIHTQGSVPREVGAMMAITGDRTWNTIGGGAGEAAVIEAGRDVLRQGTPQRVTIDLAATAQPGRHGVCGGQMQVWVAPWVGDEAIALLQSLITQLKAGDSVTLAVPLTDTLPHLLMTSLNQSAIAPDGHTFLHVLHPSPTLLIVGAGHVGLALARLAQMIDFQVWLQDDRLDLLQTLPPGVTGYEALPALPPASYIALVTRSYHHDLTALRSLLQAPNPRYIGMIGSRARIHRVFQQLEQDGVEGDRLSSIHAPIGLDIGALTPDEIAVSIGAQLIQVRRHSSTP